MTEAAISPHTNEMEPTVARAHTNVFRPKIHFTPKKNWINDPNGLVYFEGEYHLFYQYNPYGTDWGHMSWGHAVSSDLLHWKELPVAMPEQDFMVFSGSAVIDWKNTSGFGQDGAPAMVALYTAYYEKTERQRQHLAYSLDRGRHWTHFADNPVLCLEEEHFRDPKVFWHDASHAWIMVVALPRQHVVQIYRSGDLKTWIHASDYGPEGAVSGQWECPDLIKVPDETGQPHWVMKVDVDNGLVGGGSGAQAIIGTFDGYVFSPAKSASMHLTDHGPDFYAAQSWADLPSGHDAPVWLAWMSNHQTGRSYPTGSWRGAMTLPRELFVWNGPDGPALGQRPIGTKETGASVTRVLDPKRRAILWDEDGPVAITLTSDRLDGSFALAIGDAATIRVDGPNRVLELQRHGDFGEGEAFEQTYAVPMLSPQMDIELVIDRSCIEIFVDGGRRCLTSCVFSRSGLQVSATTWGSSLRISTRTQTIPVYERGR